MQTHPRNDRRLRPFSLALASSLLLPISAVTGCEDEPVSMGSGGSGGTGAKDTGGTGGSVAEGGSGGTGGDDSGGGTAGTTAGTAGNGGGQAGVGGQITVNCPRDTGLAPIRVPVSDAGHDGLNGVTVGSDGAIYATGYSAAGIDPNDDRSTIVVKFDATGQRAAGFGTNGVATVNVVAAGAGETPRGIVLQSDGKVVVAGAVERSDNPTGVFVNDRNVYVLRLNPDGSLDPTFGENGIRILDLNQGVEGLNAQGQPTLFGADAQWGLSVYPKGDDRLLVFGAQRATGVQANGALRTDTDWAVIRLTKTGALDPSFGDNGKFTLDIAQASASARTTTILDDGSVVAAGYSSYAGTQRPVIFKLTPAGKLDPSFGTLGAFSEPVAAAAEAYGAALQSTGKFVTAGYGRATAAATSTDFISIRLTASGLLDTSYGTLGKAWVDAAGFGDNARSIVVLPDDRPVLVGSGRSTAEDVDGAVAILTPDGQPDPRFGARGCKLYDFGTAGDAFTGVALSPTGQQVILVGSTGVATNSGLNNNSVLVLLPVP